MPSAEVLTWILSGCFVVLSTLFGVVWGMIRAEAKEHSRLIELKANNERLTEIDNRFDKELQNVRESNEKLVEKLQVRHDREIDALSTGFREQITGIKELVQNMERNILAQLAMMYGSNSNKQ